MKLIIINSKKNGRFEVKVDDEDFDVLNKIRWNVSRCGNSFYVKKASQPKVYIHRLILGVFDPKIIVDHKDRDTFNNQKENIRIADWSQNNSNRIGRGYSKYLGVFLRTEKHKNYSKLWYAKIRKNGKTKCLGTFETEEGAALAYNRAAIELHGEFANLNAIEPGTNIYSATG